MKKKTLLFALLLTALLLAALPGAAAETLTAGDYEYILLPDGTAEITRYSGVASALFVPVELDGHPVSAIGDYAFSSARTLPYTEDTMYSAYWQSLVTVTIPDSVTRVGKNPFRDCPTFHAVKVSPRHPTLRTENGVLYDRETRTLICYPCYLEAESFTVPKGIARIGAYAFSGAEKLRSVWVPDTVLTIEEGAFSQCAALREARLPGQLAAFPDKAFKNCGELRRVTLPEGLKSIGAEAFFHCVSLEEAALPEGLTEIGLRAFCETALTAAVLPGTVETVGSSAFAYCDGLEEALIPASVRVVAAGAFTECPALRKVSFESGVVALEDNPFSGDARAAFFVPSDHPTLTVKDGMLLDRAASRLIAWGADRGGKITAVPRGVREIGAFAFILGESRVLILPDTVEMLDAFIVDSADELRWIVIPSSVERLDEYALRVLDAGVLTPRGSAAEKYCRENDVPCRAVPRGLWHIAVAAVTLLERLAP